MSKGRARDILQADEKSANELLILIRVSPLHFFLYFALYKMIQEKTLKLLPLPSFRKGTIWL
jgi:hypothetical protein